MTSESPPSALHDLPIGHLERCQICGGARLDPILALGHLPPCDSLRWPRQLDEPETSYPLELLRCLDCNLVQIDYVVEPSELFFPDYPYRSGITATLAHNLRSTGPAIAKRYGVDRDSLAVDLGSNDGTLLSGFRDAGLKVLGVEPTNIAKIAVAQGIDTIQEFFSEELASRIVAERGHASIVTAANMFAHVAALGSLIRGVEQLLEPGGVFVTESHYLGDLLDTVQYDSIYHEHLKYYSLGAIRRLFDAYDFSVVEVDRIPNYGGSIRVHAMKGRGQPVGRSVDELLEHEERIGLGDRAIYERFRERVEASRLDLQRLVFEARSRGEQVVGVGSPGRAATLLGYCGLNRDLIPYIAEQSTSLKLGLFMPGVHTPIVDEARLFEEQPAYALMLSWHYAEPIIAKLRKKGLRSKIVVPLPEFRVLES